MRDGVIGKRKRCFSKARLERFLSANPNLTAIPRHMVQLQSSFFWGSSSRPPSFNAFWATVFSVYASEFFGASHDGRDTCGIGKIFRKSIGSHTRRPDFLKRANLYIQPLSAMARHLRDRDDPSRFGAIIQNRMTAMAAWRHPEQDRLYAGASGMSLDESETRLACCGLCQELLVFFQDQMRNSTWEAKPHSAISVRTLFVTPILKHCHFRFRIIVQNTGLVIETIGRLNTDDAQFVSERILAITGRNIKDEEHQG